MSVLVTGGRGFIGRHLIHRLRPYRNIFGPVITVGRQSFASPFVDRHYTCDLGYPDQSEPEFYVLKTIMQKYDFDYIFHLASKATVKMQGNEPFEILNSNILSTQKVCQWAPKGARVILASSVINYGDWMFQEETARPYGEEDKTDPTSIYGMTKRASESILKYYTSTGQIRGVSARMCATVGRGLTHGVVYDFMHKILNNPTLEALGDKPGSTKPYCYIDDLIDGLLLLAMKDITGEYNICPDDQINIEEVAKAVMSGLEVYKEIEWLGESANWKGDNRIISVSNSKMKSIGWSPKYSSKQAIIKAVKDIPNE
mgnify:FL=1